MTARNLRKTSSAPSAAVQAVHALPFIGGQSRQKAGGISFWDVPPAGGYSGGSKAGALMASAYLRYARGRAAKPLPILQRVAVEMLDAYRTASATEREALEGQAVGFFGAICDEISKNAHP